MKVEFFRPNIDPTDKKNVLKVLSSDFLSTWGTVKKFEENFAKYLHVKNVVGVMSCTGALHLCLVALNIGDGDEVITTPLSFVSTANSIEFVRAKPVFVDVERNTGNLDAKKIEKALTKKTKAIIPVHLYGQMCDMKTIHRIAKRHNLIVIEDAAHAVEAMRDGYRPGQLSDAGCFSFHSLKNMTCGEGGAITTNNEKLAAQLKLLRLHGLIRTAADQYTGQYRHNDMEILGWKYNMNEIQAALLLHQLERLNERWKQRRKLVERYNIAFRKIRGIEIYKIQPRSKSAYHMYTIRVEHSKRDRMLHELQKRNIGVAVHFRPIHEITYYRKKYQFHPEDFPNAHDIGSRTITLPLYPRLTFRQQNYVIKTTNAIINCSYTTK